MSSNAQAAELSCAEPAEFEFRGDVFYVTDPALGFRRAVPANTFLRNFESAAKALAAYHASAYTQASCEIIPFKRAG